VNSRREKLLAVGLTCVVVGVGSGCGPAASAGGQASTEAQSSSGTTASDSGVTAVTDPSKLILSTALSPAAEEVNAPSGSNILEVQIGKGISGPDTIAVRWQATVDAAADSKDQVVGLAFNSSRDFTPGEPEVTIHQDDSYQPASDSDVRSAVNTAAAGLGLQVTSLQIEDTAAGPAAIVIATPADKDAASWATNHRMPSAALNIEGAAVLVQVVNAAGDVLLADGGVRQVGAEYAWADPSLNVCFGSGCSIHQQGG
jgi:hypothetical protein